MNLKNTILKAFLVNFSILVIGVFSTMFLYVFVNALGTKYWYFAAIMLLPIIVAVFSIYLSVKRL